MSRAIRADPGGMPTFDDLAPTLRLEAINATRAALLDPAIPSRAHLCPTVETSRYLALLGLLRDVLGTAAALGADRARLLDTLALAAMSNAGDGHGQSPPQGRET